MGYTILEQVKIRLKQFHMEDVTDINGIVTSVVVFDRLEENPLIEQLIMQARKDIINRRSYPSCYSEEIIEIDLANYENVLVNLVVYDYSQAGESYMTSYSENGVNRQWKEREKLLDGVYSFVTVLK